MKTWFITGGTPGGFGMAYADAALEIGDRVVLTARRPAESQTWARAHGEQVLVNNAGRGWYGSIEGMDDGAVPR